MINKTSQIRVLFGHCHKLVGLLVLGVFLFVAILTGVKAAFEPNIAQAAPNQTINFQARLQTSSGAIVPDGFYNVQFNLYAASSGGSTLWTESHIDTNGVTAGNDSRLRVKNGYLTVSLGSLTSFPSTINWDQELWITMNIGGTTQTATPTYDGEMNPRLKLTGVPYAFRAGMLATGNGTLQSTLQILQPTVGNQIFQIQDQAAAGTYNLCIQNSTACGFAAASGSANYIQNTTSPQTANFNITGNGTIGGNLNVTGTTNLIKPGTNSTTAFQIQPSGSTTPVLNVDTTNSRVGIGTAAPGSALHVVGGVRVSGSAGELQLGANDNSGNLFQLQNSGGTVTYFGASTAGITIQNASAANALVFTSSDGHLKIYNPSNAAKFVDIYYDNAADEAVFTAAGGGTTRVGSGSGNISLSLSNAADILTATKTLTLGGAYSANDFNFTRAITAGATSLTGSVVNIESLSSGSANASTILRVNENNNSATGNLIVATKGGAGNDKFKVDTGGTVTIAAGQSYTSAGAVTYTGGGAVTVSSAASTALTLTGNAASTFSTTAGALTLTGAAGVNITGGTGNVTIGTSDTTGTLLVLDTKTSAGDPTGVDGAMYYNSSTHKFRCQKNGTWEDCMTGRTAKKTANQSNSTTTLADVTDLSFSIAANTDYLLSCTVSYQTAATTTGIRLTVNGPASPTLVAGSNRTNISASTTTGSFVINGFNDGGIGLGVSAANTNMISNIDVIIRNGANAGTAALRMASEVGGSNTTVNAGSFCSIQQM